MSFDLKNYLHTKREQINGALDRILNDNGNPARIVQAMRYSLMAGGKRLRPVLCIAAAEAVNGDIASVIPAACALEMIHTYSLIHDDLPAMDNDSLRRGIPTCHAAFDEATAILAGDALLTLAFELLAEVTSDKRDRLQRTLRVIRMIAGAAGYQGMIEGQMRDMMSEGAELQISELQELHELKTGRLIRASLCAGAILSGGNDNQVEQLALYGGYIGLAFQISDDILNVEGDPAMLGKSVGTDAVRKKSTYPSLFGLDHSKQLGSDMIQKAIHALELFDDTADPLRAVAGYIMERKR